MKRLLKIREFFDLKKRNLEHDDSESKRPAKRQRKGSKKNDDDGYPKTASAKASPVNTPESGYTRFLEVFENEVAKDCIWWLPGRQGEAFAMHRERFENSLKIHLEEHHTFNEFLGNLKRWGFEQMNIPSLSGRILAFEQTPQALASSRLSASSPQARKESQSNHLRNHQLPEQDSVAAARLLAQTTDRSNQGDGILNFGNLSSVQLQQAHYMVQQEIAQTYFSLLWQELQRQLSILLLQQSQSSSPQLAAAPRSEILDLAALLHQQQLQQQVMAAQFIRAAGVQPSTPLEQQTVVRELNELQQQQLSNLTYQIVALVAANLEQQNQNPQLPEAPMIHRILVKYMIALVLLQLQQQQQNLEFLRQERLTALALSRSVNSAASEDEALPEPLNTLQMQQLLSEAAMLSLSRAHQLLCEAAILIPDTMPPQGQVQIHPPNHGTPPGPFSGSGLSRTTTA